MEKDKNMNVVEKANEMLEESNVTVIGGDAEIPDSGNAAINLATVDEIGDPEKVTNINADKLKQVDDQKIIDACEAMVAINEERSNLNDQANEIRSGLKMLGIPSAAFNAAMARYNMGEHKRAELDAAISKCFKALNIGYQPGLF